MSGNPPFSTGDPQSSSHTTVFDLCEQCMGRFWAHHVRRGRSVEGRRPPALAPSMVWAASPGTTGLPCRSAPIDEGAQCRDSSRTLGSPGRGSSGDTRIGAEAVEVLAVDRSSEDVRSASSVGSASIASTRAWSATGPYSVIAPERRSLHSACRKRGNARRSGAVLRHTISTVLHLTNVRATRLVSSGSSYAVDRRGTPSR